jgi:hypothetical protein
MPGNVNVSGSTLESYQIGRAFWKGIVHPGTCSAD